MEIKIKKGEERHKKNSGGQSLANSFWQREKGMKKMNSTLLFSVKEQSLETRKLRKLLAKEEEEEVQEDV